MIFHFDNCFFLDFAIFLFQIFSNNQFFCLFFHLIFSKQFRMKSHHYGQCGTQTYISVLLEKCYLTDKFKDFFFCSTCSCRCIACFLLSFSNWRDFVVFVSGMCSGISDSIFPYSSFEIFEFLVCCRASLLPLEENCYVQWQKRMI